MLNHGRLIQQQQQGQPPTQLLSQAQPTLQQFQVSFKFVV